MLERNLELLTVERKGRGSITQMGWITGYSRDFVSLATQSIHEQELINRPALMSLSGVEKGIGNWWCGETKHVIEWKTGPEPHKVLAALGSDVNLISGQAMRQKGP